MNIYKIESTEDNTRLIEAGIRYKLTLNGWALAYFEYHYQALDFCNQLKLELSDGCQTHDI